jgi:hypothetical protein
VGALRTFSAFNNVVRLYGTLPLSPTIHACALSGADERARWSLLPLLRLPPNMPLLRLNFFSFPSLAESRLGVPGVPGRLLKPGEELREGTSRGGGGSRGGSEAARSTDDWRAMFVGGEWRWGWVGEG